MYHMRLNITLFLCCVLLIAVPGCRDSNNKDNKRTSVISLATTTSTVDSRLFKAIIPVFEQKYNTQVRIVAKGTGKALLLARQGKIDVVLVHSRVAEDSFVSEGYGVNRQDVMHNEFVLLGPPQDPARIAGETNILATLTRLSSSNAMFISRGDDSGTHNRELELWKLTGITPKESWYRESGMGMLESLKMASALQAYILSDMSTYLFNKHDLQLEILSSGDERLFNPYGVIAVNPIKVKGVNFEGAMAFINFITSIEGQTIIRNYGEKRFGKSFFTPVMSEQ
ncbi:MAG: solute-binding protein [Desulfobulbaceae bacterium]|nr:solute-binding protein [Desulfobulbaceae bacterium]